MHHIHSPRVHRNQIALLQPHHLHSTHKTPSTVTELPSRLRPSPPLNAHILSRPPYSRPHHCMTSLSTCSPLPHSHDYVPLRHFPHPPSHHSLRQPPTRALHSTKPPELTPPRQRTNNSNNLNSPPQRQENHRHRSQTPPPVRTNALLATRHSHSTTTAMPLPLSLTQVQSTHIRSSATPPLRSYAPVLVPAAGSAMVLTTLAPHGPIPGLALQCATVASTAPSGPVAIPIPIITTIAIAIALVLSSPS